MKYSIMIWPHANARYQQALRPLCVAELRVLMGATMPGEPAFAEHAGISWLEFESEHSVEQVARRAGQSAHLLLLSQVREDGSLMPICGQKGAYLGADLPNILKYKGKTNEVFTRFLLNMAVHSSAFSDKFDQKLRLFDPMCGRGTTLFEALNRGYDAIGADVDKQDIKEAVTFFKKYLEYHKVKHQAKALSMTISGKPPLPRHQFSLAATPDAFKAGDVRELSLILGDAQRTALAFPEKYFHIMAMDLPYGVQHAPGGTKVEPLERLLARSLPAFSSRLLPGGALALSFNNNTLRKSKACELLADAHFDVLNGPGYDDLAHWVEQAVTRDVVVGVRR